MCVFATGSKMLVMVRLSPTFCALTVLPSLSRAIIAVVLCVMCEPSASVRLVSVVACAL
jgi:hypothetical protein